MTRRSSLRSERLNNNELPGFLHQLNSGENLWAEIAGNLRDLLFPRQLAPLELTSTPIPVSDRMSARTNPWAIGTATLIMVASWRLSSVLVCAALSRHRHSPSRRATSTSATSICLRRQVFIPAAKAEARMTSSTRSRAACPSSSVSRWPLRRSRCCCNPSFPSIPPSPTPRLSFFPTIRRCPTSACTAPLTLRCSQTARGVRRASAQAPAAAWGGPWFRPRPRCRRRHLHSWSRRRLSAGSHLHTRSGIL